MAAKRQRVAASPVRVRLDRTSQATLAKAAKLRSVRLGDYVQMIAVAQARREVEASRDGIIVLSPEKQLAFWKALNESSSIDGGTTRLGER